LENLQQNVLKTFQEDVKRLEAEKNRLADDIKRLNEEKEQLQQVRQITEQQMLIRQLAEVLAKHISSQLQSSLKTLATQALESDAYGKATLKSAEVNSNGIESRENVGHMLDNLDDTVTIAFNSLQQELKNYQSNLSQQLSRMYDQQQQGEAILAEFVNHLRGELEKPRETTSRPVVTGGTPTVLQLLEPQKNSSTNATEPIALIPQTNSDTTVTVPPSPNNNPEPISLLIPAETNSEPPQENNSEPISVLIPANTNSEPPQENNSEPISILTSDLSANTNISPPPNSPTQETVSKPISTLRQDLSAPSPANATPYKRRSRSSPKWSPIQVGLLLVALSAVMSSLYNVAIKVIFDRGFDGLGDLDPTLGNIFLILMLRLLVVVPLTLLLAPILHPQVWQDLKRLADSVRKNSPAANGKTQRVLLLSLISGCFLFLSQVLIYIAIGSITAGGAITLFFIYPIITGLLSWFLFRERPSAFRFGAIAVIFCGELLVLGGAAATGIGNNSLGSTTAIFSGMAFAVYVILTRICTAKIHPVTATVINFATMLLLSLIGLMIPLPSNLSLAIESSKLLEVILSAFILGVLTLCGYLCNNFGIRQLGASRSAIIGTVVPILTVIFAGLMIQETLDIVQILGVLLVAVGAAGFSVENLRSQVKPSNSAN
jgi:drug/metabolite transporter (DMT)-like permease